MRTLLFLGLIFTSMSQAQVTIKFAQPELMVDQVLNFDTAHAPSLSSEERHLVPKMQEGLKQKRYQGLYQELQTTLSGDKTSAAMAHFLGQLSLQLNQNDKALAHFEHAIKQQPSYARAYAGAGLAAVKVNQFEQAVSFFAEAIKLGVKDPHLFRYLGFAYLEQQAFMSAAIAFEQAKLLLPADAQLNEALVYSYSNSGQSEAALAMLEQMLTKQSNEPKLWLQRANIYLAKEDFALAISSLETAIRLGEKQTDNLALTAQLQLQYGSVPRAIALYQKIWQQGGAPATVLDAINYLIDSYKHAEAKKLLTQVNKSKQLAPSSQAQALYLTGKLAFNQSQNKRAKHALKKALTLQPIHGQALMTLAKVHRVKQETHQAEMLLLRASEVPEVRLQALTEQADLQLNIGNTKKALALLRQALELAPNEQTLINNVNTLQSMVLQQGS